MTHLSFFAGYSGGYLCDGSLLGRVGQDGTDLWTRRTYARPVLQDHTRI